MSELENYLGTYFNLPESSFKTVKSLFETEKLNKGDFYTKTGKTCDKMSFVRSGLLRIYAYTDQKEVTQWITSPSYFVTDLYSFVFKEPARWNIEALTDCELFTIHSPNYEKLNQLVPEWPVLEKQFISGCFVMLENRVFKHLSMTAEERYDELFEANKELFNQVPLQYIASMLGMTPETFSRIRKKKLS